MKIEFLPKHQQALARVQLPCHLNHAICRFQQLGDPGARRLADAKAHCDDAIKLKEFGDEFAQPKPFFWRAKIQAERGLYADALDDLSEARRLAPRDRAIALLERELRQRERELKRGQRALFDGKLGPVEPDEGRRCSVM